MKKMLENYCADLKRIERRIEKLREERLTGDKSENYGARLEVLRDEREGLLEAISAIKDYINEVERRKRKGAA